LATKFSQSQSDRCFVEESLEQNFDTKSPKSQKTNCLETKKTNYTLSDLLEWKSQVSNFERAALTEKSIFKCDDHFRDNAPPS